MRRIHRLLTGPGDLMRAAPSIERALADLPSAEADGRSALALPGQTITLNASAASASRIHVSLIHQTGGSSEQVDLHIAMDGHEDLVAMLVGAEPPLVETARIVLEDALLSALTSTDAEARTAAAEAASTIEAAARGTSAVARLHPDWHHHDVLRASSTMDAVIVQLVDRRDNPPRFRPLDWGYPERPDLGMPDLDKIFRTLLSGTTPVVAVHCLDSEPGTKPSLTLSQSFHESRSPAIGEANPAPMEIARLLRIARAGSTA